MTTDTDSTLALVDDTGDGALPFDPDALPFDLEEFPMDASSVDHPRAVDDAGRPVKTYPYRGASIWLAPFATPEVLLEGAAALQGDGASRATALPRIRRGISMCVAGHNLRDPRTGEYYPQFWGNPDAISDLPMETLYDIIGLIQNGELADDRKNGYSGGRGGTTTRPSTAKRTRATNGAQGRR